MRCRPPRHRPRHTPAHQGDSAGLADGREAVATGLVFTQEDGSWLHPGKVTDLFVPLQRKSEAKKACKAARKAKDKAKAQAQEKAKRKKSEKQGTEPLRSRIAHASHPRNPDRVTRHAPSNTKPQVSGYLTWGFSEPPSGFEPETYALRVRCSGQLS